MQWIDGQYHTILDLCATFAQTQITRIKRKRKYSPRGNLTKQETEYLRVWVDLRDNAIKAKELI